MICIDNAFPLAYPKGNKKCTYEYDDVGHLVEEKFYYGASPNESTATTKFYDYDDSDRLVKFSQESSRKDIN